MTRASSKMSAALVGGSNKTFIFIYFLSFGSARLGDASYDNPVIGGLLIDMVLFYFFILFGEHANSTQRSRSWN